MRSSRFDVTMMERAPLRQIHLRGFAPKVGNAGCGRRLKGGKTERGRGSASACLPAVQPFSLRSSFRPTLCAKPICAIHQMRRVRRPLRLLPMRRTFLSLLLFTAALHTATNINVGSTIVTSGARRFGISGISHYYYDRLLLKNLVWRNAGFEGLQWRTVIRCDHGTATTCVDDLLSDQWPNGFWDGG